MLATLPVNSTGNLPPQPLYALGIDVGSEQCSGCIVLPDKNLMIKPFNFTNNQAGYEHLLSKLSQLECEPFQLLIGLEATGRYWENLYHFLKTKGYQIQLLHPAQTHEYAQQRRLRAKTDHPGALWAANTIARMLFSDEVRPAYVPNELITTYRELVRLQTNLTDEATRYRNEIHALLVVLFPEFTRLFADPARQTALALLKRYPSARAIVEAGVEQLTRFFQELAPHRYGQRFAQRLVELASNSVASGVANPVRGRSLAILCDQLSHTQENLAQLEEEIAALVANDKAMTGLSSVEEFGLKVVATIRAEQAK